MLKFQCTKIFAMFNFAITNGFRNFLLAKITRYTVYCQQHLPNRLSAFDTVCLLGAPVDDMLSTLGMAHPWLEVWGTALEGGLSYIAVSPSAWYSLAETTEFLQMICHRASHSLEYIIQIDFRAARTQATPRLIIELVIHSLIAFLCLERFLGKWVLWIYMYRLVLSR